MSHDRGTRRTALVLTYVAIMVVSPGCRRSLERRPAASRRDDHDGDVGQHQGGAPRPAIMRHRMTLGFEPLARSSVPQELRETRRGTRHAREDGLPQRDEMDKANLTSSE